MFTGLPGSKSSYSLLDFARDLYNLEASEVTEVRAGARVSFPASTGTRNPRGAIPFVRAEWRATALLRDSIRTEPADD